MSIPNLNAILAKDKASRFLAVKDETEQFFAPHLQGWLDLQVREGKLNNHEAGQDFFPTEVTADGIDFESGMSEETWRYGGHELHYGTTITIPHAFFDDPQSFEDDFARRKEDEKRRQEKATQAAKAKRVRELEAALEKARKEL